MITSKRMHSHPSISSNTMSVNIRLCGNIPRNEIKDRFGAPCSSAFSVLTSRPGISSLGLAEINGSPTLPKTLCDAVLPSGFILQNCINNDNKKNDMVRGILTEKQYQQPFTPILEPPTWAVPARGETRLEPVCESIGRQSSVDLTTKKAFRIGRSPNCDIQLIHVTSSRRHAMLFHHANGSCYIVDCGSAHGTYVNGKQIPSPAVTGVVVPYKVRRGALIRFGGQGAPSFVLKSFSFHLKDVSVSTKENDDEVEELRRNTRLNALGITAQKQVHRTISCAIPECLSVFRKRSFDSLSSRVTLEDDQEAECKRLRCSSPPLSADCLPVCLVSPDISSSLPRRVHFSLEPPQAFYPVAVTPEEMSSEEDNVDN